MLIALNGKIMVYYNIVVLFKKFSFLNKTTSKLRGQLILGVDLYSGHHGTYKKAEINCSKSEDNSQYWNFEL